MCTTVRNRLKRRARAAFKDATVALATSRRSTPIAKQHHAEVQIAFRHEVMVAQKCDGGACGLVVHSAQVLADHFRHPINASTSHTAIEDSENKRLNVIGAAGFQHLKRPIHIDSENGRVTYRRLVGAVPGRQMDDGPRSLRRPSGHRQECGYRSA